MPFRVKNNFIPKKILERFIKGKGPKEPNKAHGSWYYNGMIPSLQPIAKRFNVMLALRGDPDYVPTPNQIKELAKDMYPDDKEKQNWILQRMLIMAKENKQKHRIKEYLEKTQQYDEFHNRDDLNENLERFKERYGEKAEPPTYRPKGIYPSDKGMQYLDEFYNAHDGYNPYTHLLQFDPTEGNPMQYIRTAERYILDPDYVVEGMQGKTYVSARKQTIKNAYKNRDVYRKIQKTFLNQDNILNPEDVDFYTTVATTSHDKRDRDSTNRVVFREPYNYQGITEDTLYDAADNFNHNRLLEKKIQQQEMLQWEKDHMREGKLQALNNMIMRAFGVPLNDFKKILNNPNGFTREKQLELQRALLNFCRILNIDLRDLQNPPLSSSPSSSSSSSSNGSSNAGGTPGAPGAVVEAADGTPSLGSFLNPWWISSNENSSSNVSTVTPQFDLPAEAAAAAATISSTNSPSSSHSARVIQTADGTSTSSLLGAAEYSEKAAAAATAAPETMRTPQTAQIVTQNNVVANNTQDNVNALQQARNVINAAANVLEQSIAEQRQQQNNAPQNNTNALQEASISLEEASNTLNRTILAQQNKEVSKENTAPGTVLKGVVRTPQFDQPVLSLNSMPRVENDSFSWSFPSSSSSSSSSTSPLRLETINAAAQRRNIHAGDLLPNTPTAPTVRADNYNGYTYIDDNTVRVNQEFKNQVRQDYMVYKNKFEELGRMYCMPLPDITLLLYYYKVKYGSNDNLLCIFDILYQRNFDFFHEVTMGDLEVRPDVWQMKREQYVNTVGALALNIVSITPDPGLRQRLLYCFANFVGYVFFALGMQSLTYGIGSVDEVYSTAYIRVCAESQNIEITLTKIDEKSDNKFATTYTMIYAYVVLMGYQQLVQNRTINVNRRFPPNMENGSLSEHLINLLQQYNNMDMAANIGIMNQRLANTYMTRLPLNMELRPLPMVQNIKEVTSVDSEQERERRQEDARRAEIEAEAKASQDKRRARFREDNRKTIEENLKRAEEKQVKDAVDKKAAELFKDWTPRAYAAAMPLDLIECFIHISNLDIFKKIKQARIKILTENIDESKPSGNKRYLQTLSDFRKLTKYEVDNYILPLAKKRITYTWTERSIQGAITKYVRDENCNKTFVEYYDQLADIRLAEENKIKADRQRRTAMVAARKTTKKTPKKTTTTATTSNKKAKKSPNHHHKKK